ncbi:EpsG family protein [Limosilactobacillus fermentum]|uniref:EpsG family protein n=1 Tax=Limosilactobacillus fermentum TaxID=1613 RepID=UPI001E4783CD|nr:EpsG family protein [Limosilactobacillus fermentum]MCE0560874.1 EpsG family protein [Limosilactobacillus fermentum]
MENDQLKSQKSFRYLDFMFILALLLFMFNLISKYDYFFPDYINYYNAYETVGGLGVNGYNQMEIGFRVLCLLFNKLGFSYDQFYLVLVVFSLFLILRTISFFSEKRSFILLMYITFPFLLDLVQIRYLLASSLVLYAIRYLTTKFEKKYIFVYLIFNIIAITIQVTASYYLIFLLVRLFKQKNIIKISMVGMTIVAILSGKLGSLLMSSELTSHYAAYTGNTIKPIGSISIMILMLLNIISIYKFTSKFMDGKRDFSSLIVRLNIVVLPIMPLFFTNTDIFRIYRSLLILNNCVFVNSIFNFKKKDGELLIYYFIFLGSFLGIAYIFLINSNINLIKLFF